MSTNHCFDFDSVEQYLHHRKPYLMVDRVKSIGENEVVTEKSVTDSDFFLPGHFPGAPIMPGAMMQEMATQSAGVLIAARHNPMAEFNTEDPFFNEYALGVLVRIHSARFKTFARPGDLLTASVRLNERVSSIFDFSAKISNSGQSVMSIDFQLANIPSVQLQGKNGQP